MYFYIRFFIVLDKLRRNVLSFRDIWESLFPQAILGYFLQRWLNVDIVIRSFLDNYLRWNSCLTFNIILWSFDLFLAINYVHLLNIEGIISIIFRRRTPVNIYWFEFKLYTLLWYLTHHMWVSTAAAQIINTVVIYDFVTTLATVEFRGHCRIIIQWISIIIDFTSQ